MISTEARTATVRRFYELLDRKDVDAWGELWHPSADAVCVEYPVRASMTGGGEYSNENIAVFRFDGELIREYRDHFDPRRFQAVADAMAAAA